MDDGEFPALHRDLLLLPDPARLEPVARATHRPRVLLLYGSLRERSYARFVIEDTRYWPIFLTRMNMAADLRQGRAPCRIGTSQEKISNLNPILKSF